MSRRFHKHVGLLEVPGWCGGPVPEGVSHVGEEKRDFAENRFFRAEKKGIKGGERAQRESNGILVLRIVIEALQHEECFQGVVFVQEQMVL